MDGIDPCLNRDDLTQAVPHVMLDLRQMRSFSRSPRIISRARGIHLWDVEGRRYIDGISETFTLNVGHGNEHVVADILVRCVREEVEAGS